MEILKLFGIDWKLMLAQLINFAIVVAVLWYFALKPLTKTMQERRKEIQKGLDDALEAEKRLTTAEEKMTETLRQAKTEAAQIIAEAQQQAEKSKQLGREEAQQEIEQMIAKAKQQIDNEKQMMITEVKQEIGELVVKALEKILDAGLSKEIDRKYIEKVIKELKS